MPVARLIVAELLVNALKRGLITIGDCWLRVKGLLCSNENENEDENYAAELQVNCRKATG